MKKITAILFFFAISNTALAANGFTIKPSASRKPQAVFDISSLGTDDRVCLIELNRTRGVLNDASISCNGSETNSLPSKGDLNPTATFWLSQMVAKGYHLISCQATTGTAQGQVSCFLSK